MYTVMGVQIDQWKVKAHIIQCYAATIEADDEVKGRLYDSFNHLLSNIGARFPIILIGHFNTKIRGQTYGNEVVMGINGVGTMNENMFAKTCVNNTKTKYQNQKQNQINHILSTERTMKDVMIRARYNVDYLSNVQVPQQ